MRRKLIEVYLPVGAIGEASAAEMTQKTGHPGQLHQYWARRPLSLARAVLFAQLVDDPSADPGRFPTEGSQETERRRLVGLTESLARWDRAGDASVIREAQAEISRASATGQLPVFHDPFAGSGAIAIEAQRFGLDTHASDLNPLAGLISTVSLMFASRFTEARPVGVSEERDLVTGVAALMEDLRHYGSVLEERARLGLAHLYPPVSVPHGTGRSALDDVAGSSLPVIAWIWVRTVPSPNPAFAHVPVPLATTFVIASRPGQEAHVSVVTSGDTWTATVIDGPPPDRRVAERGTRLDRGGFQCVLSGAPIPFEYIDEAGRAGRLGARLVAVVAEHPKDGHVYLAPDDAHDRAANAAGRPEDLPGLEVGASFGSGSGKTRTYGMETVGDLLSDRQAETAGTLCDLVGGVRDQVVADATQAGMTDDPRPFSDGGSGALAYADAVATLLGMAVTRAIAIGNTLSRWHPVRVRVQDPFTTHSLAMSWDFAEVNPFVSRAAGLRRAISQVASGLQGLPSGRGHVYLADARSPDGPSPAIISTDPPYYDNIRYADLSDFFYGWLRVMLRDIHPDLFRTVATPRTDELVVGSDSSRTGGKAGEAVDTYEHGMTEAFRAIAHRADAEFPMTFITTLRPSTSQSPEAMRSSASMGMLGMLAGAGLQITAVWPVRTDPPGLVRRAGSDDRPSPAIIVARRRPEGVSQIGVREFIRDATGPVRDAVARLTDAGMAPADIAMAALGPGMAVLTGVPAVVGADGNPVPLDDGMARLRAIACNAMEEGDLFDEPTRQAVGWFDRHGYAEASIDEAGLIPPMAFMRLRGDRARLARPDELAADASIPTDLSGTAWHALGSLLDANARGGDLRVLSVMTGLGDAATRACSLAFIVYAVADRRGRPADAVPADQLVRAWPSGNGTMK